MRIKERQGAIAPSVPVRDSSDDTGDGILILEPLLGIVPKVACAQGWFKRAGP